MNSRTNKHNFKSKSYKISFCAKFNNKIVDDIPCNSPIFPTRGLFNMITKLKNKFLCHKKTKFLNMIFLACLLFTKFREKEFNVKMNCWLARVHLICIVT